MNMILDASFYDTLSALRLSMGHRSSMNLTGNRKSIQKGSSTEFSDFREYMPGDDIRRIDWNAYGRLDRLFVKEYMEEKEAVVSILIDTSASMNYGANKKSNLACMLAAAIAYIGLNNMDRVVIYGMGRMQSPFVAGSGRKALPRMAEWLNRLTFEGEVDINEAVRKLPAKGQGMSVIISDFWQESFLSDETQTVAGLLRFLDYRRQKSIMLHVLAGEELSVELTGTRNLIDMEKNSALRLTLEDSSIRVYENALQDYILKLKKECARLGAFYAVCSTGTDFYKLIFQDLRMLYDI